MKWDPRTRQNPRKMTILLNQFGDQNLGKSASGRHRDGKDIAGLEIQTANRIGNLILIVFILPFMIQSEIYFNFVMEWTQHKSTISFILFRKYCPSCCGDLFIVFSRQALVVFSANTGSFDRPMARSSTCWVEGKFLPFPRVTDGRSRLCCFLSLLHNLE